MMALNAVERNIFHVVPYQIIRSFAITGIVRKQSKQLLDPAKSS
jgi:hypothetical protein